MAKITKAFTIGEEIPATAKYICNIYDKGKHLLVYEIKVTNAKKNKAPTNGELGFESEEDQTIHRVITYLNKKTGSKFKPQSKEAQKFIKARLKDGAIPEDFKNVIDNMCKVWLGNEKMQIYLRPKTLFGNEFESYLSADKKGPGSEALENVLSEMNNMQDQILKNSLEGNNGE